MAVETPSGEKKAITDDNKEVSNLEQFILNKSIGETQRYYLANKKLFNYLTFRQVNGESGQVVNKLRGLENLDVFYKIKNSTLSLLQPKIRIFKVNYEEMIFKGGAGSQNMRRPFKVVKLPTPCYREFKFSDNFGQEVAASVEDYLAYESTKPSWRNVGLKTFKVKWDGRGTGAESTDIECTLKLSFKGLKDLQAQPPGEPPISKGGLRYADLILWPPSKIDSNTETYNPMHYEIKVLLGYTAPAVESLHGLNLSASETRALLNIEKLNSIVSLTLQDYSFDIQETGQVFLTAKYRGRIEAIAGSNHVNTFVDQMRVKKAKGEIFPHDARGDHNPAKISRLLTLIRTIQEGLLAVSCKGNTCEAVENFRELIADENIFRSIYKEADGPGIRKIGNTYRLDEDATIAIDWMKKAENAERLQALLKNRVGLFKKNVFKSFIDKLIDGNPPPTGQGTRLFCINANRKMLEDSRGVVLERGTDDPATQNIGPGEGLTTPNQADAPTALIGRPDDVDIQLASLKAETAEKISTEVGLESQSQDDTQPGDKKIEDQHQASILSSSEENYKFYFLYLGDIIELACRNAGFGKLDFNNLPAARQDPSRTASDDPPPFPFNSYANEEDMGLDYAQRNVRVLVGPMEYINAAGGPERINLAQFPISFNLFRAWFIKKVIRPNRMKMSLGSFITSLVNDLVMAALERGMPKSFKDLNTKSNIAALCLPGRHLAASSEASNQKICGRDVSPIRELLPMERTIDLDSAEFRENYLNKILYTSSESMMKTSYDYMLVFISTIRYAKTRTGDPIEDLKDGIYHFNIGSDRGLVKNINFIRNPLPYQAERAAARAREIGGDALEQLKLPHNSNLTLIGNSLFIPGMYYYVNPSFVGLGSIEDTNSIAHFLSLGGYHLIMTVETSISAGEYTTKITGMQQ